MQFTGERYVPGSTADTEGNTGFEHWQRYLSVKPLMMNKRVVDVASGEGYGSDTLAEVAASVLGVDISPEAVEHASKTYHRENLHYLKGSVTELPVEDHSVDAVVSFETIEHVDLKSQHQFLKEVCRVLDKDGVFYVSCPNEPIASQRAYKLWGYVNPCHVKEHTIESFQAILGTYFSSVQMMYQRTEDAVILSEPRCSSIRVFFADKWSGESSQNIIAVCSAKAVDLSLMNSIVFDIRKSHLNQEKIISDYIRETRKLNVALESGRAEIDRLGQEKHAVQSELEELNVQKGDLEAANTELKQALEQSLRESAKLTNINTVLRRQFEQSTNLVSEQQAMIERMHEEVRSSGEQVQQAKNDAQSLKMYYENSYSWRMTKLLRKIVNALRRSK